MSKNRKDRKEEQEIENSLKVSSYLGDVINAIEGGSDVSADSFHNTKGGGKFANESSSLFQMDAEAELLKVAGLKGNLSTIITSSPNVDNVSKIPPKPQIKLSQNQIVAIKKYPALIDFLGTEGGRTLVKEIAVRVNEHMVTRIESNSKEISKFAQVCVPSNKNIKQYFVGPNEEWACVVTASGPFRGDEAILYKKEEDESFVLRKIGDEYENVTSQFNIVHELGEKL